MKCITCGTDSNFKDRSGNGGKCPSCQHPFTFDPMVAETQEKIGGAAKLTDQFFLNQIARVSHNDTLFFTERQLMYFFNGRLFAREYSCFGCLLAVGGVAIMGLLMFVLGYSLSGVVIGLVIGVGAVFGFVFSQTKLARRWYGRLRRSGNSLKVDKTKIHALLERWKVNNPLPVKLLPPPRLVEPVTAVDPEIAAYSFDRVIVTDRPAIAQFLLANYFHFENNCAVLSIDGYPSNEFDTVMTMLRRNPTLSVYALHDASCLGIHLVHRLRNDPKWFKDAEGIKIFDLGILPRQIFDRPVFVQASPEMAKEAAQIHPAVRATLQPKEIEWLEKGYFVELESFSPHQLLTIIRHGIARSRNPEAVQGLMLVDAGPGYIDSGSTVYAYDTFG